MTFRDYKPLFLSLAFVAACSSGGGNNNPGNPNVTPADMAMSDEDGGMTMGGDMAGDMAGGGKDGGGTMPDLTMPTVGLPCVPGSYRCGPSLSVEICNGSGSAWLYSATCTVGCSAGLCTGACEAGTKRCNGKNVEACNMTGSAYTVTESCTTFCEDARCAMPSLDVTSNKMLDGDQLIDGDIIIRSGATLTSPAGDLTLRTRGAIMVEMGASIVVNPTGNSPDGTGTSYYGGGGGGYGSNGGNGYSSSYGGSAWGSTTDIAVMPGAKGGNGGFGSVAGGNGGGVLRLIAGKSITVAGQITANGASGSTNSSYGGGGGSGGGVLLATPDKIIIAGSITANGGGAGSASPYYGGAGGQGRVKLLNGGVRTITGSINAVRTEGLLPPTTLTSASHPNQNLIYNDDFPALSMAWTQSFVGVQGYYHLVSRVNSQPPTPANGGKAVAVESVMIPSADVKTGENWFHIVPIDSMSNVGTVENTFKVTINSTPPALTSSSHPSQGTWYASGDAFFNWTFPNEDKNYKGVYYILDRYGDTIPNSMGTMIPVTQKNLLRTGLANGIWVMHMVPIDQRNYLTKTASHFKVYVGTDPGKGTLLGQVVDGAGKPVVGAKVTINRGLFTQTTNAMGSYNFMTTIPAGTWEIRATSADGLMADLKMDSVTKDGTTTVNLTLK